MDNREEVEDVEEEAYLQGSHANEGIVSLNSITWSPYLEMVGRVQAANVFSERIGFRPGLHPKTRTEALEVFFGTYIDIAHVYTNTQGNLICLHELFCRIC